MEAPRFEGDSLTSNETQGLQESSVTMAVGYI